MDWNLNSDSWDLSEFKQETTPNLESFDSRSASFATDHGNGGGFSIDLKLGRVSHSTDEVINQWKQQHPTAAVVSSPSVSVAKRARAGSNGAQAAYCLVDGCNADLSNSRDYHKRHKVCEVHSKSPQVTIVGQNQRFCQQCSRFHSLEEFDEGKRSCRKRLDGHNRRRRKPQPDPLSRPASFMPGFLGSRLLPFSSSHVYPSTTVVSPPWSGGAVNTEANAANHFSLQQQMNMNSKPNLFFGSSLGSSYRGGKQFPFLQVEDNASGSPPIPEASVCQPLLNSIALSESSTAGGGYSMFCDKQTAATTTQVRDSGCARSLLSSPRTQTSSGNHLHQPNSIPFIQQVDPMDSLLVSNGRDAHSPWSSVNQSPQTLPFNWE